jgi:hypothetical protein
MPSSLWTQFMRRDGNNWGMTSCLCFSYKAIDSILFNLTNEAKYIISYHDCFILWESTRNMGVGVYNRTLARYCSMNNRCTKVLANSGIQYVVSRYSFECFLISHH